MQPQNNTNWISKFNLGVTSGPALIYANGRQQLEITVEVVPTKEDFTQEELDSITLVTFDGNSQYAELTGEFFKVSAERDETYQYHRNPAGSEPPFQQSTSPRARYKKFYVCSIDKSYAWQTIYAAIYKGEKNSDGEETRPMYVSHTSLFNKKVNIKTVEVPRLTRSEFTFWGEDVHWEEFKNPDPQQQLKETVDIDVYHIKFKNPDTRLVKSKELVTSEGEIYRRAHSLNPVFWGPSTRMAYTHLAYKVGTKKKFSHRGLSAKVSHPYTMNLVRIKEEFLGLRNAPDISLASWWLLIDQQGNSHLIKLNDEADNIPDFTVDESYYDKTDVVDFQEGLDFFSED